MTDKKYFMENFMTKEKNYVFEYDLMRFIFILMTLGVHVVYFTVKNENMHIIFDNVFMICNPLFFMLSGKLNLSKKFNSKEDYVKFYKGKLKSIIIPFLLFSLAIQIINNRTLKGFGLNILSNNIEPTYWFIYTLIGIELLSPFYSKMLQNMNKMEKKFFLVICIFVNFFIMLFDFLNMNSIIGLGTIGIVSWHFYYFSGYIIEDIFKEKNKRIVLYLLGMLSFLFVIFINIKVKYYYNFKEPGLFLTLQAFSIYLTTRNTIVKNDKIKFIISYISRYTYTFYLLHMFIIRGLIKYICIDGSFINVIEIYIILFVIIMCISIIIQILIIKPIQNLFEKICPTKRYTN